MKVVVATDRSETARHAVDWAAGFARGLAGELVLLHVLQELEDGAEERLRSDASAHGGARALVRIDDDVARGLRRSRRRAFAPTPRSSTAGTPASRLKRFVSETSGQSRSGLDARSSSNR